MYVVHTKMKHIFINSLTSMDYRHTITTLLTPLLISPVSGSYVIVSLITWLMCFSLLFQNFLKVDCTGGLGDDRIFVILWNFVMISMQHTACKSRCNRWGVTVGVRALRRCKASAEHTSKKGKWLQQQQQLPTWAKRFTSWSCWFLKLWFQSYNDETTT